MKNETTNERLIALESRVNLFPCVQSVSTENTDRISLSPTEATARDLYKKVQTHVSERIGYTSGNIFSSFDLGIIFHSVSLPLHTVSLDIA